MSEGAKRLKITCPCCQATLQVEPETGMVLKSQAKKSDYSIEEGLRQVKERKEKVDDVFAKAMADEKKRHDSLEEKFRKALDAKDELEDPTRPWDYD